MNDREERVQMNLDMSKYIDPIVIEEADIENLYDFNGYITYEEKRFLGQDQVIARYFDVDGTVQEIGTATLEHDIKHSKVKAYGNLLYNIGQETTKRRELAKAIREQNEKTWKSKKDLFEAVGVNYVYGSQIMELFHIELNRKRRFE